MRSCIPLSLIVVVVLSVGCPPQGGSVTVPDTVGLSRYDAENSLESANLTLGAVTEVYDSSVPRYYVVAQNPAAGASVNQNTSVALTVSLGVEPTGGGDFTPGTRVESGTSSIGTAGGDVSGVVGGVNVTASFPDGALPGNVAVTLAADTGTVTPLEGEPGEAVILLETPGVWYFDEPVELTFALSAAKAADTVPVPYLIDEDGDWHLMDLVDLDWANLTATVATYCPTNGSTDKADNGSAITWVYADLSKADVTSWATFVPFVDGFAIGNEGSTWNPSGECHGMVLFAQWYCMKVGLSEGSFFYRFRDAIGTDGLIGQDLIATRAQNSSHEAWEQARTEALWGLYSRTPAEQATTICNALANAEEGVVLCLADGSKDSHAVLAYDVETDASGTHFSVYDPNYPYNSSVPLSSWTPQTITLKASTGTWEPYGKYIWVLLAGSYGSMADHLRENFESILVDAEDGFHDSADAVIVVTSHTDEEIVLDDTVRFEGYIDSGEVLVEEAWVYVYGEEGYRWRQKTDIPANGSFSLDIALAEGENHIVLITLGRNAGERKLVIPNNMTRNKEPHVLYYTGTLPLAGTVSELRGTGNPPIAGATVKVYKSDEYIAGTVTDTATTSDTGQYAFLDLEPGEYVVTAEAQGFEIRLAVVTVDSDGGAVQSFQLGEFMGCYTTGTWGFEAPTTGSWPDLSYSLSGGYWQGSDSIHRACDYYTESGWFTMTWWTDMSRTSVAKSFRGVCNSEDGPISGTYIAHVRGIVESEDSRKSVTREEFDAVVTSW